MGTESIILTQDIEFVSLDLPAPVLCVHHRTYPVPVAWSAGALEFSDFARAPRQHLTGLGALVIVGLNRIMTPSNRTQEVFEILFNLSPALRKVSIDRTLFIAEPWRSWFHFGLTGTPDGAYTYSYLAESHATAYRDGRREDDSFSLAAIAECGRGVVRSIGAAVFRPLHIDVVETDEEAKRQYQAEKVKAFGKEQTLAGILLRLSAFASAVCPSRRVPSPGALFSRPSHRIVRTDLRIDEFLVGRLAELIALSNGVHEAFR